MKLCPYPFSRVQTTYNKETFKLNGAFFPCCPSWFNDDYLKIEFEKNLEDIWNGDAARQLRERMYEGDFSFCNRHECNIPLFSVDELADPSIGFLETPISPENIEAIRRKDPVMPVQPASLHLSADLRCNLSCPTCRPKIIPNSAPSAAAQEEYDFVHKLKDSLEIIKMSSSGEVFYSHLQRELLKSFNPKDFPKLQRVHIVSNGTLFNQKTYDDLSPGTGYIKDISISMDAGTKATYEKIRGPFWEQVVNNLEWLGQMRKSGKFDFFSINFTLIKENYKDIPAIIELGKKFNVDRILIQKYLFLPDQGYKTEEEQMAQAIHLPEHPDHKEMVSILKTFKDEPILYTLLDIPGFEEKISNDVNVKKAWVLFKKAEDLFNEKQYAEALQFINQSLDSTPSDHAYHKMSDIYFELGLIELQNDNANEAAALLEKAIKTECKTDYVKSRIETFIYKSQAEQNFKLAVTVYEVFRKFSEASTELLYSAGQCYKVCEEHEKASECFNEVLKKNPDHIHALIDLAYLDKTRGRLESALEQFIKLQDLVQNDRRDEFAEQIYFCLIDLAFVEKDLKNAEKALDYFRRAQAYEPAYKMGAALQFFNEVKYYSERELGFQFQKQCKYKLAIEKFSSAIASMDLVDLDLYFSYGVSFKRTKQYDLARKYFNKILTVNPEHYLTLLEMGSLEINSGNKVEALDYLLNAKAVEPLERKNFCDKYIAIARRGNR